MAEETRKSVYMYIYSEDAWSSNRKALEKYEAPVWKAASTQSPLPFFLSLLPQSSRRYTIVSAIWIKARRVDAYLLGIPILQLSVSPCSPNARPSLPTTVGHTCVRAHVRCNSQVHVSPMRMHVHRRKRERGVNTEWTLASGHEVWWTTDSAWRDPGRRKGKREEGGLWHLHERYRVRLTDSGLKIELFIYRGVGV